MNFLPHGIATLLAIYSGIVFGESTGVGWSEKTKKQ